MHHGTAPVSAPLTTIGELVADTLRAAGIELAFAEMKDPVKDKLKRFGLFTRFGESSFSATIGEAVSAYLKAHPVEWVDWEDRASPTANGTTASSGAPGGE